MTCHDVQARHSRGSHFAAGAIGKNSAGPGLQADMHPGSDEISLPPSVD